MDEQAPAPTTGKLSTLHLALVNPFTNTRYPMTLVRPVDYFCQTKLSAHEAGALSYRKQDWSPRLRVPAGGWGMEIFQRCTQCKVAEADLMDRITIRADDGDPERLGDAHVEFSIDGEPIFPKLQGPKVLLRDLIGKDFQLPQHYPDIRYSLFSGMLADAWLGYMVPNASSLVVRVTDLPAAADGLVLGVHLPTQRYTSKVETV